LHRDRDRGQDVAIVINKGNRGRHGGAYSSANFRINGTCLTREGHI
jgi:hypothetical protein